MKTKTKPGKKEEAPITPKGDEESQQPNNLHRKRISTPVLILLSVLGLAGVALLVIFVLLPLFRYNKATSLLENKQYDESIALFESLGEYRDAPVMVQEATYQKAGYLLDQGRYDDAIDLFTSLDDYRDSQEMIREANYRKAGKLLEDQEFEPAIALFETLLDYKDSTELQKEAKYQYARQYVEEGGYYYASELYAELAGYKDSASLLMQSNYQLAIVYYENGFFELALELLNTMPGHENSAHYVMVSTIMLELQGTWEKDTHSMQLVFIGWKYFMVEDPYGSNVVTENVVKETDIISDDQVKIATGVTGLFIEYDVRDNQLITNYYIGGGKDAGGLYKEYSASTETNVYRKLSTLPLNTVVLEILEEDYLVLLLEFPYLVDRFPFPLDR